MELQLPLLFICDSHLLSVIVTSVLCSLVFQLISHIYLTSEPLVLAFCIVDSLVVVPNCSFTFKQAFLLAYLCQRKKKKKKTKPPFQFMQLLLSLLVTSCCQRPKQIIKVGGLSSIFDSFQNQLSCLCPLYIHRRFKINFPLSYCMVSGKQLRNLISISES